VARLQLKKFNPVSESDNDPVYDCTADNSECRADKRFCSEQRFPDNDRSESDDDHPDTHSDICKTAILRDKSSAESDECVRKAETEDNQPIRICRKTANHALVVTSCPYRQTNFRF